MPDLAQVDQTCLPTSTANLIIWFGHHGYPKLIADGADEDEADLHTLHRIMADTDARFDWGTRMESVTTGIEKYIKDAGYTADIEYRGLQGNGAPFRQDWLKENDDPNKGFILLLAYCHYDRQSEVFSPAWSAGHAVTLVNAEPGMLLIHDPAHYDDETGRKIITPYPVTEGTWRDSESTESAAGLLLLSGSLLEGPPHSEVLLVGAVCVAMHPPSDARQSSKVAGGENATTTLAGTVPVTPAVPVAAPSPAHPAPSTWWGFLFRILFEK